MGARAYRHLSLYDPAPGCLIEIGSERGEGSTAWLHDYAQRHRLRFYTADIDLDTYTIARGITSGARNLTGTEVLRRLRTPVSVAYMDGFDWIPDGQANEQWIGDQRARYATLGHHLDNDRCQQTHLEEARLITGKANERCAVICDDTWLGPTGWTGKGGLAVPHFVSEGFTVVDHDGCKDHSLGYVVLKR